MSSFTMRYRNHSHKVPDIQGVARQLATRRLPKVLSAVVLMLWAGLSHADPLLTYPLRIGEHVIRAELANTPRTRQEGLMFRERLASSSGMIFVFTRERLVSMWMKNTLIPLSVAFIGTNGRILNIEDMEPHSQQTHSSIEPALYALETNRGWFEKQGIQRGDSVTGLELLPPAK